MSSGKEHESKVGKAVVVTGRAAVAAADSIKLFSLPAFDSRVLTSAFFSLSFLI
jgi:hypothetical protein